MVVVGLGERWDISVVSRGALELGSSLALLAVSS